MLLEGKIIVITGGAGLLGKEFAKAIITAGGRPILADIDDDKLKIASRELSKFFSKKKFDIFLLNITSEDSLQNCIKYLNSKYKKIDALVNNAYPRNNNYGNKFFSLMYDDLVENLGMNLGGCIISSQSFSSYFIKQGYGNIINIASIYGVIAPKFNIYKNTQMTMPIEYAAIKSGLIHLTKYMAKYLKDKNIRVNAISPGGILDNQPKNFIKKYNNECLSKDKGLLGKNDISGTLIFLLSDMSSFINGQNIIVDDGFSL